MYVNLVSMDEKYTFFSLSLSQNGTIKQIEK